MTVPARGESIFRSLVCFVLLAGAALCGVQWREAVSAVAARRDQGAADAGLKRSIRSAPPGENQQISQLRDAAAAVAGGEQQQTHHDRPRQQPEQQQQQQQQQQPQQQQPTPEAEAALHARPPRSRPSDRWRPLVVSRCAPGLPQQFAPCVNLTNLQLGEEVIYPDFRIRMPRTQHPWQQHLVAAAFKERFRHDRRWAYFLGQHGRNFVLRNTSYGAEPPPRWARGHCMSGRTARIDQFGEEAAGGAGPSAHERVMFAASPDGGTFQHFLDRVAMMLVQADALRDESTKFIALPPRSPFVAQAWQYLTGANAAGLPPRLLTPGRARVGARSFVFACDTPLLHPYLTQRVGEDLMEAAGLDPAGRPLAERKVVLLVTRMGDGGVRNGGRRWLNHDECRPLLQALLDERGQGEVLEDFSLLRFASLADAMAYFSTRVRAVVAPHGGALYNLHWVVAPSTVVEIWPFAPGFKRHFVPSPNLFFELSRLRELDHWVLPAQTEGEGSSDFRLGCSQLVEVLRRSLGQPYEPPLEPFYQGTNWSARKKRRRRRQ